MALPFIATALIITTAWNLLTDWVWIGDSLNFLPEGEQNDIQKRALSIKQLIDSARNLSYSATKTKRQLNQQEKTLIKEIAETAEKQINDLKNIYTKKFVLYGKKNVIDQMNTSTQTLLLELAAMKQDAGLIPRAPIKTTTKSGFVSEVFDGDTIQINQEESVRLVGIDAPESTTTAGEKSKKYLKDRLWGKMVRIESDSEALTDMYGRRLGVVYLGTENINIEMLKKGLADFYDFEPNALVFKKQWKAAADEAKPYAVSAPKTKIFSGIITQGKLGKETSYIERRDDLIDSMTDLQIAAENNLTAFLLALPGRIIYEIKTTPEITTKSGFKQRGALSQILTGYKKDGTPKYKSILNKFAILNVYVMTEKNIRTKIQSIVLGPMDAVAFQPNQSEIINVEKNLQQNIFSKDVESIKIIETSQPPIIITPQIITTPVITPAPISAPPAPTPAPMTAAGIEPAILPSIAPAPAPVSAPVIPTVDPFLAKWPSNNSNKCNVSTISEFFDVNRMKYPLLAERAPKYEEWGLGQAAYYTGTAEQNNKFLAEIKKRSGCSI